MAAFIGQMGGFGILALVAMLIGRFLLEMGWIKDRDAVVQGGKAALFALLIGICYLLLGSLYSYFTLGSTVSVWDFQTVWEISTFKMYIAFGLTALGAAILGRNYVLLIPFAYWLFLQPIASGIFLVVCILCRLFVRKLPDNVPLWIEVPMSLISAFVLFGGV